MRLVGADGALGRGGLLTWTLSCIFCALLVVGRIIRAKNPSSGLLVLTRDLGRSCPLLRDAREVFLASIDVVDDVLARGGRVDTAEGLLATGLRASASVGDLCVSCLAADAAVGAVAAAGSFVGFVGDFGSSFPASLTAFGEAGACSFLPAFNDGLGSGRVFTLGAVVG